METNTDGLPRIRVLVDASRVLRCEWCCTTQSDSWKTKGGGVYCSDECKKADMQVANSRTMLCFLVFMCIFIPITNSMDPYIAWLCLFGSVLSLCGFFVDMPPRDYKKKVPKDSRSNTGILDISLLKTIATHIECPNCDGNIDLSKVKEDMVYHCDYCGADGIIELVKTKQ